MSLRQSATEKLCDIPTANDGRRHLWVACFLTLFSGCFSSDGRSADSNPISRFQNLLQRDGSVTFQSFDGQWQETPADTILRFSTSGEVHLVRADQPELRHEGTYLLSPSGVVTVRIKSLNYDWPEMLLALDSQNLTLRPKDSKRGLVLGSEGSVTIYGGTGDYWPFRQVTLDNQSILDVK